MGIELMVLGVALVIIAVILIYTLKTGISPHPTSQRAKKVLLAALPEDLQGTVYELGSGWGTLAFSLARHLPQCRVEAFELSWLPWLFSRLLLFFQPLPNLTIHRLNFMGTSLSKAALATCYLYPGGMEKLKPKLEAELPPGALVLSNAFAVPGWTPHSQWEVQDMHRSKVYLYKI